MVQFKVSKTVTISPTIKLDVWAAFVHSFVKGSCHFVSGSQTQGRTIQDNPKKAPPAVANMINLQGGAPDAQLSETLVPENQSYSQEFERWGTHTNLPMSHIGKIKEARHRDRERCCEEDRKRGWGIMPGSEDSFWGWI